MLWTRILRSFLGIIVLALASAGVTTALLYDKPTEPAMAMTAVADFLVHDLAEGDSLDTDLRTRAADLSIDLALWHADGRLIAGSVPDLPGPKQDMVRHHWVREGKLRGVVIPLTDGRSLTAAIVDRDEWRGLRYLLVLLVVFGVLGAGSYLIARRLTERLERLTHQVQSVGPEHLDTQVDVDGEDEVAELATAFNESVSRISSLVKSQKNLLAMVSHELRSPLARIRMAVELMDGPDTDAKKQHLSHMRRDIEELDQLIGDLLLASRLELQSELETIEFDLFDLARDEAERVGAQFGGESAVIEGDPRLIRRAIRNLLENGARHGAAPLEVTVSPGSGGVDVRVDDAGAGVPVEHRLRIFDPFYRPEGLERGVSDGAGLGLYLVSQIAQVHGGRVDCSEGPTGGARFTLTVRTGSTVAG